MKLYFNGHDYKYAAEQMIFTLFPGEKPEYPEGPAEGDQMEITLTEDCGRLTAQCVYRNGQGEYSALSGAKAEGEPGSVERDSLCQRLIKEAVYRAALASGLKKPVWGALTGVRPGKLLKKELEELGCPEEAVRSFREKYDVSEDRAALCMQATAETVKAEASLLPGDVCLYVGIPFCPTRCAYCSFVSQSVEKSMAMIPRFLDSLQLEIEATAKAVSELGLRPVSVYMGGGTPTTLSPSQLDALLGKLEREFDLSAVREFTVEAGRPDTITKEKLAILRAHGVDRISVNPQTMSDSVLEAIGRKHTGADIVRALGDVRQTGGFAVNMDLIAGLPTDTAEGFADTLKTVIALKPENITVHTLSLKKGSGITVKGTQIPPAAEVSRMLDFAGTELRAAGYAPYYLYRQKNMSGGFENVGYAKAGYVNLYNICIMEELCSIIAMGGGGSTKLIHPAGGRSIRLMAPKYPGEYTELIDATCAAKSKILDFYRNLTDNSENGINEEDE